MKYQLVNLIYSQKERFQKHNLKEIHVLSKIHNNRFTIFITQSFSGDGCLRVFQILSDIIEDFTLFHGKNQAEITNLQPEVFKAILNELVQINMSLFVLRLIFFKIRTFCFLRKSPTQISWEEQYSLY